MKKIVFLLTALFLNMGIALADNVSVESVTIPKGGTATVVIRLDNPNHVFTGGQMALSLPDGITAVMNANEEPDIKAGERFAGTNHSFGSSHQSNGTEQFTIFSINSAPIPGESGVLLYATITADASLAVGTALEGRLMGIEMATVDAQPILFNDQVFTITIGEPLDSRIVLDELSTMMPEEADGVDVRVKRTLAAGIWNTIVLPFAMDESQVKDAFGEDVQLADFTGYTTDENINDEIISIAVHFQSVNNIEENHPYLIKVSENINEFSVDGVDINPEEEPTNAVIKRTKKQWSEMIGTYTAETEIPAHTLFISGNKFWYSTGETKMKGFRAYFDFYDELADVEDAFSKVAFYVDNVATNIESNHKAERLNDNVYDLQGRKMTLRSNTSLPKGIYIVNGKKYTVK
ncbi:MAG: hypothetical protein IKX24_05805 [Prevotella sp.]|nr:hypothetical protein [Prevotella sp.]